MIDRREMLKLGTGSILAFQAAPLIARTISNADAAERIVVFNEDYEEGRAFAREVLSEGGQPFAVAGAIEPRRRDNLYRRLLDMPTVLVGLTTEENAFQIKMLAGDAFHFEVSRQVRAAKTEDRPSLVAWVIAPVREVGA